MLWNFVLTAADAAAVLFFTYWTKVSNQCTRMAITNLGPNSRHLCTILFDSRRQTLQREVQPRDLQANGVLQASEWKSENGLGFMKKLRNNST